MTKVEHEHYSDRGHEKPARLKEKPERGKLSAPVSSNQAPSAEHGDGEMISLLHLENALAWCCQTSKLSPSNKPNRCPNQRNLEEVLSSALHFQQSRH
ncbi:hypothetical protein NL676_037816 [Syzygium grande]|nr:hypothetical protein NL676_037816 [Syzygium grande]